MVTYCLLTLVILLILLPPKWDPAIRIKEWQERLDTPEDLAAREQMLDRIEQRFWDRGLDNITRNVRNRGATDVTNIEISAPPMPETDMIGPD